MIYVIGLFAQLCFSARILIQWLMSERARKVLSPTVFWILSLAGAYPVSYTHLTLPTICSV